VEKEKILPLPGLEFRPLGPPAGSQSLYCLRYPSNNNNNNIFGAHTNYEAPHYAAFSSIHLFFSLSKFFPGLN
jgi:hypothetical protein